jgi:uncharacterized protein (DUF362 family)
MSDHDDRSHLVRRRQLLGSAAAAALAVAAGRANAQPAKAPPAKDLPHVVEGGSTSLVARPPAGFVPLSLPGRIVRVDKANTLLDNGLWPKQEAATAMLERAMSELTGESDLGKAFAKFVHPADKVAIKPNGIAGRKGATMAANKELVLAIVRGVIAAGVPATNIHIYEQYPSFMAGTRIADKAGVIDPDFPAGVTTSVHENKDATMDEIPAAGGKTRYVRAFTEATAVINVTQIKDHGICGYTGTLKNITHGSIVNPHDFHAHNASPQIAQLYAQRLVTSRVRLHITDGFKLIYDEGPLDKNPSRRIPHEAVYACTDPVAMDVIGWGVVEKHRRDNGLPTLKDAGREPTYIRVASELGLGVFDKNHIRLREVRI